MGNHGRKDAVKAIQNSQCVPELVPVQMDVPQRQAPAGRTRAGSRHYAPSVTNGWTIEVRTIRVKEKSWELILAGKKVAFLGAGKMGGIILVGIAQ